MTDPTSRKSEIWEPNWIDTIATHHSGGITRVTNNTLDVAIDGKGFFAIQTPAGVRYTRNGSFTRSAGGELVTQDGHQVLGLNGPIVLDPAGQAGKVTISEDGRIFLTRSRTTHSRLQHLPKKTDCARRIWKST